MLESSLETRPRGREKRLRPGLEASWKVEISTKKLGWLGGVTLKFVGVICCLASTPDRGALFARLTLHTVKSLIKAPQNK